MLFWRETVATPASTFLVVDILVLAAGSFVMMFAEGRRLGIGAGYVLRDVVAQRCFGLVRIADDIAGDRDRLVARGRIGLDAVAACRRDRAAGDA